MYQQPVHLLVQRPGVGEPSQQAASEIRVEVPRVQHQKGVGFQKVLAQGLAVARAAVSQVALYLVNGE